MESSRKQRILIVDDDSAVQVSLALLLKQSGFDALCCDDPRQALALLSQQTVDLVLQDMNFSLQTSGEEGLQLLAGIKHAQPALPVLLMTAWGSIALAVRGVQAGAANFFTKPWDNTQLVELIRTTLETTAPATASAGQGSGPASRQSLDAQFDFSGIVGEHPRLLKVLATIGQVAATRAPVLILGESGCGKELVADAIHRNSPRAARPIVKINMGAITPSLFESEMFGHVRGAFTDAKADRKGHVACAHEGTLFLDEIGELNRSDQVKLLRVLQDQTYQPVGASRTERADVRIVSATNRELAELVASGEFREDLFYRLNLITIRLPPLRERRSDIPLLARHIIGEVSASYGLGPATIAPQALEWLSAQPWPGNIRQLKQTLERTLLLVGRSELRQADFVAAEQHENGGALGLPGQRLGVDGMTLEQVERHMIAHALEQHQGNISRVAKTLGLSRTALYRRLERHGLGAHDEASNAGQAGHADGHHAHGGSPPRRP
jgi:two-component system NtrC family response regulator